MTQFEYTQQICSVKDPLVWNDENRRLMVAACREMALFHQQASPDLAALYARRNFDPASIKSEADLARIPTLMVTAMKHFLLLSQPESQCKLKVTSSGTSGQKTQLWLDEGSFERAQTLLLTLWDGEGWVSKTPVNYLSLNYDPNQADDLGIAFSLQNLERFAPARGRHYAIQKDENGEWRFDVERTLSALTQFATEGLPVRIMGMPAFLHALLEHMNAQGISVKLPGGSLVMTAGGWKKAENKRVSREELRSAITDRLGIPAEQVRDAYGMAEHAAPYLECASHRFHVPAYNRIIILDPVTFEPAPAGTTGLIELVTPFNAMMPALAILSTDLGVIDTDPCPCGRRSPTFQVLGRAGTSKHKGCALTASELLSAS